MKILLREFDEAVIWPKAGAVTVSVLNQDYHSTFKNVTISKERDLYIIEGDLVLRDFNFQSRKATTEDLEKYKTILKEVKPWFGRPYKEVPSGWITLKETKHYTYTTTNLTIVE